MVGKMVAGLREKNRVGAAAAEHLQHLEGAVLNRGEALIGGQFLLVAQG